MPAYSEMLGLCGYRSKNAVFKLIRIAGTYSIFSCVEDIRITGQTSPVTVNLGLKNWIVILIPHKHICMGIGERPFAQDCQINAIHPDIWDRSLLDSKEIVRDIRI